MLFSIFALVLAKSLPKRVFLLYFCSYASQSSTKKGVFSIFTLTLTKAMRQMVFSLFLPYSNQSTATKVFFSLFALILTKALPKMVFFSIICSNANQSYAIKGGLLFFFCLYSNQRTATKGEFLYFDLNLTTKALRKWRFFL